MTNTSHPFWRVKASFTILFILFILGILRIVDDEISYAENSFQQKPIAKRFEAIKTIIPTKRIGYLTDAPPEASESAFYKAQYGLAPYLVVTNENTEFVVVDLSVPERYQTFCILHSIEPTHIFTDGLILAHRDKKP